MRLLLPGFVFSRGECRRGSLLLLRKTRLEMEHPAGAGKSASARGRHSVRRLRQEGPERAGGSCCSVRPSLTSMAGVRPNMRRHVRLRWAESANPAS